MSRAVVFGFRGGEGKAALERDVNNLKGLLARYFLSSKRAKRDYSFSNFHVIRVTASGFHYARGPLGCLIIPCDAFVCVCVCVYFVILVCNHYCFSFT